MLKISRPSLPPEIQQRLDEFDKRLDSSDTDIWKKFTDKEASYKKKNQPTLRQELGNMFHEKCVYCEVCVQDVGEIEHYIPKKSHNLNLSTRHPMFDWNNLLLSCHDCNKKKGLSLNLLNPCHDDPLEYLKIDLDIKSKLGGRINIQDDLDDIRGQRAENTYQTLGLNQRNLPERRRKKLKSFCQLLCALKEKGADAPIDNLIGETVGSMLLELLNPTSEYLASIRQFLHEKPICKDLLLKKLPQAEELINQWDLPQPEPH